MGRSSVVELTRFGLVGILTNVVYFGALYCSRPLMGLPLWLASGISYALSMLVNYLLQRRVTFRSDRPHVEAGARYLGVQLTALGLNSLLLDLLVTRLGAHFALGQGVALVVTTSWSYICQKLWVFKRGARGANAPREVPEA